MLVQHKDPQFSGTVVVAATELTFVDGVAEADLDAAQVAAAAVHGWRIVESDEVKPLVEEDAADTESKKREPRKTYEVGVTVPVAEMEKAPPVIG